jgi:predicted transcriptional regulator
MSSTPQFTRDVLVSIRPNYASKIVRGEKTVELRRRFPEAGTRGAIALIYSTSPVQAVVGFARIKRVLRLPISQMWKIYGGAACISKLQFNAYFFGLSEGYAILFDRAWPLKQPLTAGELYEQFGIVPPQSYRYVTADCIALLHDEQLQASGRHEHRHRARRRPARSGFAR